VFVTGAHRNTHAGPRNQTPRCGTAKESPQTPRVAAAWSSIKLAAVCSLWSGTSCAAMAAKIIPPAPVTPAKAAAAHAHLRRVPELCFISRSLFSLRDHCSSPFLIRPATDAVRKSRKGVIHFLFRLYSIFIHFIPP
jgi:hypothetical protein